VFGVDLRGHGDSERGSTAFADAAVDDVLAVVDQLGLQGACVFGHSIGGTLAVCAQQRRPGLWRALYLYEPVIPGYFEEVRAATARPSRCPHARSPLARRRT